MTHAFVAAGGASFVLLLHAAGAHVIRVIPNNPAMLEVRTTRTLVCFGHARPVDRLASAVIAGCGDSSWAGFSIFAGSGPSTATCRATIDAIMAGLATP